MCSSGRVHPPGLFDRSRKSTENTAPQLPELSLGPSDTIRVPEDPYSPEVTAATYELRFGKGARPPRRLENKSDLSQLAVRPPREDKRYIPYLENCRKAMELFEDACPEALVGGPWSIAVGLRGIEDLVFDTVDDPEFVHSLMRFTTEISKQRGEALAGTGVRMVIGDPSCSCSLISPKIYRDFVKPYHKELADLFNSLGASIALHICGYTDPIMEDLVELDIETIEIDAESSLERIVQISQGRVVIRGNFSNELFIYGNKDEVEEAVKRCIDIAAKGSGYILSPGCVVPHNIKLENLKFFIEAAHKYGRY